ncbi:hypothetical protein HT031_005783 [Scenedesmus sp. PABB004]|nr:hypothetical protein HT031_005783 [Scenedesmus sp. PABB004]
MAFAKAAHVSGFQSLRETMERCALIVSEAYAKPPEELEIYEGELPPGHRASDRRQRYWVTEAGGDMVVALPGTTHPLDWSSNMRVHYVPIDRADVPPERLEEVPCAHAGFYFRAETVPTLGLLARAAARGCRLVLTGHSLGGAVANLCALTALEAQKKALAAAEDAAGAALPPAAARGAAAARARAAGRCACAGYTSDAANHSCCSSNSDIIVGPAAALVEVLCVSFASPIFANAALAAHIDDNGWVENFVNVVVPGAPRPAPPARRRNAGGNGRRGALRRARRGPRPAHAARRRARRAAVLTEDYCLKLFNNVLTSAEPAASSRSSSSGSLRGSKLASDFAEGLPDEPDEPPPPPPAAAPAAFGPAERAAAAPPCPAARASSSSCSGSGDCGDGDPPAPRHSYNGQAPGQPLVSALAGKGGARRARGKRQLSFAQPVRGAHADGGGDDTAASGPARGDAGAADARAPRALACAKAAAAGAAPAPAPVAGVRWAHEPGCMPSSPSNSSLLSEDSLSSTRSWTLLAYLPDVLTSSFSGRLSWGSGVSGGGSAGGRDSADGGGLSGPAAQEAAAEAFSGWGMRHARSSVDLAHGLGLCDGGSSSSGSSNSLCGLDDDLAAPFVSTGGADAAPPAPAPAPHRHAHGHGHAAPGGGGGGLRRSLSSASLRATTLLRPLASVVRADSLSLVAGLLPSVRGVVSAGRSIASAAGALGGAAFNVPLSVLEAGLIRALRPPMYVPAGQQWVLSAHGLVPQAQPMEAYPRHVHDVFWHKDLMLVAFREHSIVFYKQRLLTQAARR